MLGSTIEGPESPYRDTKTNEGFLTGWPGGYPMEIFQIDPSQDVLMDDSKTIRLSRVSKDVGIGWPETVALYAHQSLLLFDGPSALLLY